MRDESQKQGERNDATGDIYAVAPHLVHTLAFHEAMKVIKRWIRRDPTTTAGGRQLMKLNLAVPSL
jgi:hypothetical protein